MPLQEGLRLTYTQLCRKMHGKGGAIRGRVIPRWPLEWG